MILQGKIPKSAKAAAFDLIVETQWQKYVVYDLIIKLALLYQAFPAPPLPLAKEDQDGDIHKSPALTIDTPVAHQFRRLHRIVKDADFFRHAMHSGTELMTAFIENRLPNPLTQAEFFASIQDQVGKADQTEIARSKQEKGLERLAAYVVQPTLPKARKKRSKSGPKPDPAA